MLAGITTDSSSSFTEKTGPGPADDAARASRLALLDFICRSVASSAHPGFLAALRGLETVSNERSKGIEKML